MKTPVVSCAVFLTLALGALNVYGDSATWSTNPINNDWNTAENWMPNTVPNGPDDVATFGLSHQTTVFVSTAETEVNQMVFNPGASPFTINVSSILTISGIGITNNSGITKNFVCAHQLGISLKDNATVGDMAFFTLKGGHGPENKGGFASFSDAASAGNGTFVLEEPETDNAYNGGQMFFRGNSTAGNSTITLKAGSEIDFFDNSTAANGTFSVDGGDVRFGSISVGATAGNGVFIITGGSVAIYGGNRADNATLIASSGGAIRFLGGADGVAAQIKVYGDGILDLSSTGVVSVGSVEGDGLVELGSTQFTTGANSLSTTFSGLIEGLGSLTKIGGGTLTLTGENTYTAGTTIDGGKLVVANKTGSGTGSGTMTVKNGQLAGSGIIAGATTIGTGSGTGAFLAPAAGTQTKATLTIENSLTFSSMATYIYTFKAKRSRAQTDKVVANGVTINSNATINLLGQTQGTLTQGLVLTVIDNTSANPISGTFSNLPDGGIVTVNSNNFQVSYSGGDGNNLTLTVVP